MLAVRGSGRDPVVLAQAITSAALAAQGREEGSILRLPDVLHLADR